MERMAEAQPLTRQAKRMELRAPRWVRFLVPLALITLSAREAHAQKVPELVIWSAGASLFAPFVAVPVKLGILRMLGLEARASRLWSVSAIEWVLWFPVAFLLLRSGRSSAVPLIVLALFAAVAGLHWARVTDARWRSAVLLSLATPLLALALPFAAFAAAVFLESLSG